MGSLRYKAGNPFIILKEGEDAGIFYTLSFWKIGI